jgi:hypothetical protein
MNVLSDIDAQQRMERRQIREDAELFGELMKHKGWGRFVALVERVAQNYHAQVMKPLDSSEVTKLSSRRVRSVVLSLAAQPADENQ